MATPNGPTSSGSDALRTSRGTSSSTFFAGRNSSRPLDFFDFFFFVAVLDFFFFVAVPPKPA